MPNIFGIISRYVVAERLVDVLGNALDGVDMETKTTGDKDALVEDYMPGHASFLLALMG